MKVDDPEFWNELSVEMVASNLPASNEVIPEDMVDEGDHDEYGDDSSIGLATVVKAVVDECAAVQNLKTMGGENSDRGLVQEMLMEDDNEEPVGLIDGADQAVANQVHNSCAQKHAHTNVPIENLPEQGHGRRKKGDLRPKKANIRLIKRFRHLGL